VIGAVGLLAPLPRNPPADSFDGYLASAGMNFRLKRGRVLATEQPPNGYHTFLERAAIRLNELLSAGITTKRPELTAVYRAMMLGQKHELSDEQDAQFMQERDDASLRDQRIAHRRGGDGAAMRCSRWRVAPGRSRRSSHSPCCGLTSTRTGASPSAVRAFVLVACSEAAMVLRRPANGIASLSAASSSCCSSNRWRSSARAFK